MVYGFLVLCCAELWCAVLCFAWLCWAVLSCAQGGSHRASILTQKRLPLQSYYMLGFPCAVLCCALLCCAGLCWAVLSLADAAQPWAICSNVLLRLQYYGTMWNVIMVGVVDLSWAVVCCAVLCLVVLSCAELCPGWFSQSFNSNENACHCSPITYLGFLVLCRAVLLRAELSCAELCWA